MEPATHASVGSRLRVARTSQRRSLADVASRVGVSCATLSRIETDKQSVDVALFLELVRSLGINAADVLGSPGEDDALTKQLVVLDSPSRTKVWSDLAEHERGRRASKRDLKRLAAEVEELLAHIDLLREELLRVRRGLE